MHDSEKLLKFAVEIISNNDQDFNHQPRDALPFLYQGQKSGV
jgi:hypothetical protein